MIKINLANTFTKKADSGTQSAGGNADVKSNAIKVALLIVPLIALYIYEKRDLSIKREELAILQEQSTKMDADLAKVGSIDNILKQVSEQKKELEEKFNVVRKIFGLRTKKIQTLVVLQQQIPPSSWLTKINAKNTDVEVRGYSNSIDDAQIYINKLAAEKSFFSSVNGKDVAKVKINDRDVYRFDIILKLRE